MVSAKLAVALAMAFSAVEAASGNLPPITVKGTKFYYSNNGTQFFIKGVAYQQNVGGPGTTSSSSGSGENTQFVDPLADTTSCKRDIPYLQKLGVNAIRTYAIDPTANHDTCMQLLDAAGIYVISDLSSPAQSINQIDPAWDVDLYSRYTSVIDALSGYNNVIGFFAGNEVSNQPSNTNATAFVKAAVRDMKAYIKSSKSRWFGVGYALDDDQFIRRDLSFYLNCGDQTQAVDFLGLNIYEWCGSTATFQSSGYQDRTNFFSNYSVPVFFAEYGCNNQGAAKRPWTEVAALFGNQMTPVWSGGLAYEYFETENDFGLVTVSGSSISTIADFGPLQTQYASATPSGTSSSAYSPSNSPQACPPVWTNWTANAVLPPTPDTNLCTCAYNSLSCVPSSKLAATDYGTLFNTVCGLSNSACAGIVKNAATGVYGAYSMCNSTVQLGVVLNAYYQSQNSASSACDFNGQAQVVSSPSAASSCSSALSSASSVNSVAATATQGSSTSGSSSSASSSKSSVAAPMPMRTMLTMGDVAVGLYAVVAMITGAAFFML